MSRSSRKLAAIVFTDVVGFTELSAADELGAIKLLEHQRKSFQPIVAEFGGKWLKELGDGLLLSFESSLDAVRCAVELQTAARKIDGLQIRIGIHQGDIVLQGSEILGDGVNIASRIEPLAPTGGIALSEKIQQDISSHPEYTTQLIGEPELKGVSQPLRVYCLTCGDLPTAEPLEAARPSNQLAVVAVAAIVLCLALIVVLKTGNGEETGGGDANATIAKPSPSAPAVPLATNSIAVLPFEDLGDGTNRIWTDGVPDEIRRNLSRDKSLKVISRKSSEQIRGDRNAQLGAYWLLDGTVLRQANGEFVITVELSRDHEVEWSERFAKVTFENLFETQEQIAREVARRIRPMLIASVPRLFRGSTNHPVAQLNVSRRPTDNFDAWVAFLEGKQHWIQRTPAGLVTGRARFERAIALDESFALAHCYLALSDVMITIYGMAPAKEAMPRARAAAEKALSIDGRLGEAHAVLGYIQLLFEWDWGKSRKSFETAIELNPSFGFTYSWFAQFYRAKLDADKELELARKARELEPLNPILNAIYAEALYRKGNKTEAINLLKTVYANSPQCILPPQYLGIIQFFEGDTEAALAQFQSLNDAHPGAPGPLLGKGLCIWELGKKTEAMKILQPIIDAGQSPDNPMPLEYVFRIHRSLGNEEEAYKCIEQMVAKRAPELIWLQLPLDRDLEFYQTPRFRELMAPVGFDRLRNK